MEYYKVTVRMTDPSHILGHLDACKMVASDSYECEKGCKSGQPHQFNFSISLKGPAADAKSAAMKLCRRTFKDCRYRVMRCVSDKKKEKYEESLAARANVSGPSNQVHPDNYNTRR